MKLPRFLPILTSFTARVAGRELQELLQSSTLLARALAETQAVVGHDGVLCIYEPSSLQTACLGGPGGATLKEPEEVLHTAPVSTQLEAIEPLRHRLPDEALVIAAFAGPCLLWSQLRGEFDQAGRDERAGPEYAAGVIRTVIQTAFEQKADGIALIERTSPSTPPSLLRAHKMVRKLADFFDAGFMLFKLPGSDDANFPRNAHAVFDLQSGGDGLGPVSAEAEEGSSLERPPMTTAGDVPADTAVDDLKALMP